MIDKASSREPPINRKSIERFENEGGTTRAGELCRKKRSRDFDGRVKKGVRIATSKIAAPKRRSLLTHQSRTLRRSVDKTPRLPAAD